MPVNWACRHLHVSDIQHVSGLSSRCCVTTAPLQDTFDSVADTVAGVVFVAVAVGVADVENVAGAAAAAAVAVVAASYLDSSRDFGLLKSARN